MTANKYRNKVREVAERVFFLVIWFFVGLMCGEFLSMLNLFLKSDWLSSMSGLLRAVCFAGLVTTGGYYLLAAFIIAMREMKEEGSECFPGRDGTEIKKD
jgi:hypothetical protein